MENTLWSILPPILAIGMVLLTRRVLLSLGVGIVSAAFLLADFSFKGTAVNTWEAFKGVFADGGEPNTWNIFILIFILMLGILTAFISMMGGTRAFGDWMIRRVKTRAGAQIMTMILGVVVFIDDYFNALTVGQVSRPITDKHRVSRAKLAYIIDSTSAPVCVVAPVSSWGAYIIGLIGTIIVTHGITEFSAFSAFMQMIPMNLYVWAALGMVLIVALRGADFGPMKIHEQRAQSTGEVHGTEAGPSAGGERKLPVSEHGRVLDLALPLIILFVGTIAAILWTGYRETASAGDPVTLMNMFGNADVPKSLVYGGAASVITALILYFISGSRNKIAGENHVWLGFREGIRSMIPSCSILILAWAIVSLIDQLQTGAYLAGIVEQSNINVSLLPAILFVLAGFMAFSTGTSWGSFAILLPIAGEVASAADMSLILPMMAAVLAGSVFGDHCSPISDTTILSSAGSNCNHIDHVTTQMPYAVAAAIIALVGYVAMGLSGSTWVGLLMVAAGLAFMLFFLKKAKKIEVESEVIAK
ncbi:MAG TPA: Na+/H+ antiporter NhaC family protein [Bacillaceae bacterium]